MAKSDKTETSQETESEKQDARTEEEVTDGEIVQEVDDDAPNAESQDAEPPEDPETDNVTPADAVEDGDGLVAEKPTEEDSRTETPENPDPAPRTAAKRGGFVPMVLGGVVAAGIGFGAATYMQSQGMLLGADREALAAVEAQLAQQKRVIDEMRAAQEAIAANAQSAMAASTDAEALEARVADIAERVGAVTQDVSALAARLTEAEKRPMSDGLSASAIEAYEREVEELRAQVAAQLAEAEALKANSEQTARETLVQAALTRVRAALESGAPYQAALIEFANASGETAPPALADSAASGVATLPALIDAFPEAARAALAEARKGQVDESAGSRIGAFLKAQLGARSVTPQEGTDPDAILSRAEDALRNGDIAAALAEIDALPPESQAHLASWREAAETRAAAVAAAEALAQGLTD